MDLFLDDDAYRHKQITGYILGDKVFTAHAAIELLKTKEYDTVYLDHDLGDEYGPTNNGYTVALWIAEHKPKIEYIIIHSLNPVESNNMTMLLKNSGYACQKCQFPKLMDSFKKSSTI